MVHYRRRYRHLRKTLWLLVIVFLFVMLKCFKTLKTDRPTPKYDVSEKPRFLYRSRFRENPDHEYEATVDSVLRKIEERVMSDGNEDREADKTVWQIMLVDGPIERSQDSIDFESENYNWNYQLMDQAAATALIQDVFSEVPDLVWVYNIYPHNVLRADLLRYLILWYYGGYYADMDVIPACPIDLCPSLAPLFGVGPEVSLVLGIEVDEPYASSKLIHEWRWIRWYGFAQYNVYAPRRFSPLLRKVIVRVLAQTKQHYQGSNHDYFLGKEYDEATILETTGPGVFTDAILDGLSETLPQSHSLISVSADKDREAGELGSERRVTWAPFHRLKKPLFIDASEATSDMGGLAVMPINVWGSGQRHSGAGPFRRVDACVNHRFKGAWKPWKKGWWEYFLG